jgi:predicted ATP-grasp superfamily ATP-dependent carboligase
MSFQQNSALMTQTVFIFEHICGGGMIDRDLPDELIAQGFGMLRASIEDFIAAGHRVLTVLDHRVPLSLEGLEVSTVKELAQLEAGFDRLASRADAVLVIAPEFDHLLEKWLRRLEELNVRSLGCTPMAAALCGDKLALAQRLEAAAVPTVKTSPLDQFKIMEPPVVIKPRYGAGCEDTFYCGGCATLDEVAKRCLGGRAGAEGAEWIIQAWCQGLAVSISFMVHEDQIEAMPAGAQDIVGSAQLRYEGGLMPLESELNARAQRLGRQAVEAISGLRGFVGVDLVLVPLEQGDADAIAERDAVIEINPRLTVSYCGLRAMCENNLAAAMLDANAPLQWLSQAVRFDSSGRISRENAS